MREKGIECNTNSLQDCLEGIGVEVDNSTLGLLIDEGEALHMIMIASQY